MVAHEDDSLLFQSPDLLQDIRSGRCVRTVFLTAGDDGKPEAYWLERETGAEAGYARMSGVADEWEASTIEVDGHPLHLETLEGDPRVSLVFMRLPDGGYPAGEGTPAYGNQSLMKLWNGAHSALPAESSIAAVDGSATYDFDELIDALAALMTSFEPQWIATQNYDGTFTQPNPDHMDHVATAKFTREAQRLYTAPHQLIGYEDYETSSEPANVQSVLLEAKEAAFAAYSEHDEVCTEGAECELAYQGWLERQYEVGTETTGVVANAGYAQVVDSGEMVELDGSGSSAESGHALTYEWVQIAGPAVELSDATSAKPSFAAPPAEASLSFSLTVSDGTSTSEVDVVNVQVEGEDPTPTAVAGEGQSVSSGATVTLDGSHSVNPYGQPLEYEWTQTAGSRVALTGAATAEPSFIAPPGPALLTFSLVVTNAAAHSVPSAVTVTVTTLSTSVALSDASIARPRLSRHKVELVAGKRGHRVVFVLGPPRSRVWCTGGLPKGARCRVVGKRRIVIEATRAAAGKAGVYKLTVHIASGSGTTKRPLTVRLVGPRRRR